MTGEKTKESHRKEFPPYLRATVTREVGWMGDVYVSCGFVFTSFLSLNFVFNYVIGFLEDH